MMTKRQAIAEVRACADAVIEQRTRQAMGWDKGIYRDDDTLQWRTISQSVRANVQEAFRLSVNFAKE